MCASFGKSISKNGWMVSVETVAAALKSTDRYYNFDFFCANTYNWSPDWAIESFIKNRKGHKDKNVVSIAVGGGSTDRSQRVFEDIIKNKKAKLLDSKSFWLWKPNDNKQIKESNAKVASEMAGVWARQIADKMGNN